MEIKLKIRLFAPTARTDYERQYLKHIIAPGMAIMGDDVAVSWESYVPCDVAVILYSPRNDDIVTRRAARAVRNVHGQNLLIFESPLFRSAPEWRSRFGFDHVHGAGRFAPVNAPTDRIEKLGVELKPWKTKGDTITIAGQVSGDYSLDGVNSTEWVRDVAAYLSTARPEPIVVRPHPKDTGTNWSSVLSGINCEISTLDLALDLQRSKCWISFTSGSSIDAVLAGVPSIALNRNNLAWDVSRHSLQDIDNPICADRTTWLARLSYSVWSKDEFLSGEAWKNLRPLAQL